MVLYRSRLSKRDRANIAINPLFLNENPRWVAERKVYAARVYTIKQARMIPQALRDIEEPEADPHLPQDVADAEFNDAKPAQIDIIPLTIDDKIILHGVTYPLMEKIKVLGYNFQRAIPEMRAISMPGASLAPSTTPPASPTSSTSGVGRTSSGMASATTKAGPRKVPPREI